MTIQRKIGLHYFILQSFLAGVAVFIILSFLTLRQSIMVASLGATAFIVFAMPKSITAKPRNIVGGYLIGILAGTLITLVPDTLFGLPSILYSLYDDNRHRTSSRLRCCPGSFRPGFFSGGCRYRTGRGSDFGINTQQV